ncbi:MAG: TlpA family protein disulfide reductase [Crocinitomicaceae bacterium]|nr:TlpA family protein disulfide reductase [Crocinitomicaceae bacterium]
MRNSIVVLISLFIVGCGESTKENNPVIEEEIEEIVRNPINVVEGDDISVEVYDFETIQPFLNKKNDKVNVINFWATWCKPCVAELPYFEDLGEKDPDVEITLISLDFPKMIDEQVIPFIKENELKSEVIVLDDPNGNEWIPKIDPDWSGAIPATIIYNQEESTFYEQSFTFEELEKEVNKFKTK